MLLLNLNSLSIIIFELALILKLIQKINFFNVWNLLITIIVNALFLNYFGKSKIHEVLDKACTFLFYIYSSKFC